MAGARVQRIGTIFTRMKSLLETGAVKEENRPIWFDIYKRFPPTYSPSYDRPVPDVEITKIFYKEDILRARVHKEFPYSTGIVHLQDSNYKTKCQKCVDYYYSCQAEGLTEEEAMQKAVDKFYSEETVKHTTPKSKSEKKLKLLLEDSEVDITESNEPVEPEISSPTTTSSDK